MGYRAHIITQEREYGGITFSDHEMFVNQFISSLYDEGYDINADEQETFFEIEKEQLQKLVDSLPANNEVSIYPAYTNEELKKALQFAINETESSFVSWEWF